MPPGYLGGAGNSSVTRNQQIRATLPRSVRLGGQSAFSDLFTLGEGLRRGQVVLKYRLLDGVRDETHKVGRRSGMVRAGFVVRRSAGAAPRRNRLRRLLRESYRMERIGFEASLHSDRRLDLVLLWSGNADQALRPNFEVIRRDVAVALVALGNRIQRNTDVEGAER